MRKTNKQTKRPACLNLGLALCRGTFRDYSGVILNSYGCVQLYQFQLQLINRQKDDPIRSKCVSASWADHSLRSFQLICHVTAFGTILVDKKQIQMPERKAKESSSRILDAVWEQSCSYLQSEQFEKQPVQCTVCFAAMGDLIYKRVFYSVYWSIYFPLM